ncbi:MAG TPA: class I SAM-dependent methyltransferase [Candidatus Polarisedimenticolaceae bacterium]|nr:class I SAM-dependent methyltransferase [Candidatus Polarisedimenticolaceae bacterium]
MDDYDPSTYGNSIAEVYDRWYASLGPDAAVACLRELAGGAGPVLELGIGTGRIALPLSRAGVEVHGIDSSAAMVAKLRSKPGGDRLRVTLGDFADVAVGGRYPLIFVAFNTLFALTSQEDQLRCFRNVAGRLDPRGRFVLDAFVPDLARFERNQRIGLEAHDPDAVRIEASLHDPVRQTVTSRHVVLTEHGAKFYPLEVRYAWPSELDLMARLAGLRLVHRWGDWNRLPFDSRSTQHVSVYERDAQDAGERDG